MKKIESRVISYSQSTKSCLIFRRTRLREAEIPHELHAIAETGENRKFTAKWTLTKEKLKNAVFVLFAVVPVGVSHCDLVQVWGMTIDTH